MLTINVVGHPLMQRFHKPTDKKRMVVILLRDQYDAWLLCKVEETSDFLMRFPASQLTADAVSRPSAKSAKANHPGSENGWLR